VRKVGHDDGDPPAERPALWQGEGQPRSPQAGVGWDDCQVGVPDVIGPIGSDAPGGRHGLSGMRRRLTDGRLAADAADGRGGQMQAGAGQDLRDLDLAQPRTETLQALHDGADEVGKPVDWLRRAQPGVGPFLVEAFAPGGDRRLRDLEDAGSLG